MYGQSKVIISEPNKCAARNKPIDVSILRVQYRICGILTGTLPHLTQQNFFLGLPLLLMPEEVVLLIEKGLITSS